MLGTLPSVPLSECLTIVAYRIQEVYRVINVHDDDAVDEKEEKRFYIRFQSGLFYELVSLLWCVRRHSADYSCSFFLRTFSAGIRSAIA